MTVMLQETECLHGLEPSWCALCLGTVLPRNHAVEERATARIQLDAIITTLLEHPGGTSYDVLRMATAKVSCSPAGLGSALHWLDHRYGVVRYSRGWVVLIEDGLDAYRARRMRPCGCDSCRDGL